MHARNAEAIAELSAVIEAAGKLHNQVALDQIALTRSMLEQVKAVAHAMATAVQYIEDHV